MNEIINGLWFFLPAGVANAAPVIANRVPLLNRWKTPIDFGQSYRGKRILGDNKTWRGLIFGTMIAGLTGLLQHTINPSSDSYIIIFIVGALLGFGALYGDAVESFFKRQRGVNSGNSWFPFDQTDYIIGALIAVAPLQLFSWKQMAAIVITYFGLHLLVAYLGFLLKLKDKPL